MGVWLLLFYFLYILLEYFLANQSAWSVEFVAVVRLICKSSLKKEKKVKYWSSTKVKRNYKIYSAFFLFSPRENILSATLKESFDSNTISMKTLKRLILFIILFFCKKESAYVAQWKWKGEKLMEIWVRADIAVLINVVKTKDDKKFLVFIFMQLVRFSGAASFNCSCQGALIMKGYVLSWINFGRLGQAVYMFLKGCI